MHVGNSTPFQHVLNPRFPKREHFHNLSISPISTVYSSLRLLLETHHPPLLWPLKILTFLPHSQIIISLSTVNPFYIIIFTIKPQTPLEPFWLFPSSTFINTHLPPTFRTITLIIFLPEWVAQRSSEAQAHPSRRSSGAFASENGGSGCRRSGSRARRTASGSAPTPPPRRPRWPTTSHRIACVGARPWTGLTFLTW